MEDGKMYNEIKTQKGDKVYLLGTGNQAPYGIGEIIDIIPAAHIRKIAAALRRWHNPPKMRLNGKDGLRVSLDWEGNEPHLVQQEKY